MEENAPEKSMHCAYPDTPSPAGKNSGMARKYSIDRYRVISQDMNKKQRVTLGCCGKRPDFSLLLENPPA